MKRYYYACLESKEGKIERRKFETRQEARDYINSNFDSFEHRSAWTE